MPSINSLLVAATCFALAAADTLNFSLFAVSEGYYQACLGPTALYGDAGGCKHYFTAISQEGTGYYNLTSTAGPCGIVDTLLACGPTTPPGEALWTAHPTSGSPLKYNNTGFVTDLSTGGSSQLRDLENLGYDLVTIYINVSK